MQSTAGGNAALECGERDMTTPSTRPTYLIDELATLGRVKTRTVRHYVAKGLLPRPRLRGAKTSYGHEALLRLLAIKTLRRQKLSIAQVKRRLSKAPMEELERLAGAERKPAAAPPKPAGLPQGHVGPYRAQRAKSSWDRILICPGVELFVLSDADAEARRVAAEIEKHYGPRVIGARG